MDAMDCSIVTKASPELVWQLFCDWEKWGQVSDAYQNIRWVKGEPWTVGSVIEVQLLKPFPVTVAHEIKSCLPMQSMSWTDHVQKVQLDQTVVFTRTADGGTRIDVHAEFVGPERSMFGFAMGEMVRDYNLDWYEKFRQTCDRAAESALAQ